MAKDKGKAPKAAKPAKGKDVSSGSLGIGDAFAYGISAIIEEQSKKGSEEEAWLGKKKITLDPVKAVNREKLDV